MGATTHFISEAASSVWRARRSKALSILTICAAVFVLGAVLLITTNLSRLVGRWTGAAEVSIYLGDTITPDEQAAIPRMLGDSGLVSGWEYISKTDAVRRFNEDFPDLSGMAESLGQNPLPASFEVRLKPDAAEGPAMDELVRRLRQAPGAADVRYDRQWIDRVRTLVTVVRWVGLGVVAILALAAALTVASVVRLALYARQDEIEIMQLVGAPLGYIRGPFVAEGTLQGGIGALAAVLLLWGAFAVAKARYGGAVSSLVDPSMITFLPASICALLIAGGMGVGLLGGVVAARAVR